MWTFDGFRKKNPHLEGHVNPSSPDIWFAPATFLWHSFPWVIPFACTDCYGTTIRTICGSRWIGPVRSSTASCSSPSTSLTCGSYRRWISAFYSYLILLQTRIPFPIHLFLSFSVYELDPTMPEKKGTELYIKNHVKFKLKCTSQTMSSVAMYTASVTTLSSNQAWIAAPWASLDLVS